MRRPALWMVKQCAIAAGNVPNWNFNGPETHAEILESEKLKQNNNLYTLNTHTTYILFSNKSSNSILIH